MIFRAPEGPLEIPAVALTPFLMENAERHGAKPALIDAPSGRTLTYRGWAESVRKAAAGLSPNGPQLKASDVCVVVGCPFTINGNQPSPCSHVQWIPSGGSLDLDCHSVGIVIGANGVPQGPVIIVP